MKSSRDPLDDVLATWRVQPRRDAPLRARVAARLAAGKPAESWTGYLRGNAAAVSGLLALAVVLGAIGGRSQARARAAAESERLANAYVQALDARTMLKP